MFNLLKHFELNLDEIYMNWVADVTFIPLFALTLMIKGFNPWFEVEETFTLQLIMCIN